MGSGAQVAGMVNAMQAIRVPGSVRCQQGVCKCVECSILEQVLVCDHAC